MGDHQAQATRRPGGGRKPSKPDYDSKAALHKQMEAAVALYGTDEHPSLQAIADQLSLNPIKVRKLLITAGVYESEIADQVKKVFDEQKKEKSYTEAVQATCEVLHLSKASVASYLPYKKGVYFPETADRENISVEAERQRRFRAVKRLQNEQSEENLWKCVIAFQGYKFKTFSGLTFTYTMHKGRGNAYTRELFIDRRENSKSLAWSSVMLAFRKTQGKPVVDRPKALGDIRGVTYIYGMFYRFGLIEVPEKVKEKMEGRERV